MSKLFFFGGGDKTWPRVMVWQKPFAHVGHVRPHASTFSILTTASDDHSFPQSRKMISWQLRNPSSRNMLHQIYELLIDISFYVSSNSNHIFNGPSSRWSPLYISHIFKFCIVFVPRLALPNLTFFQFFEILDLCGANRVLRHVSASRQTPSRCSGGQKCNPWAEWNNPAAWKSIAV